eukprot:11537709-Karenia_brevis.AAC.1
MASAKLKTLADLVEKAGLIPARLLIERHEARVEVITRAFMDQLSQADAAKASEFLQRAQERSQERWCMQLAGSFENEAAAPRVEADPAQNGGEGDDFEADLQRAQNDGREGEARLDAGELGARLATPHVQRELSMLLDRTLMRQLLADLEAQGQWPQIRRIKGLMNRNTSHDWLWKVNHAEGSVLAQEDFIINLQKRLGAVMIEAEVCCRKCGACLDAELWHCETCAPAAATRGHYTT